MTKAIKFAAAAVLALPAIAGAQGTQAAPAPAAAPAAAPAQQSLSQSLGVYAFPAKQQTKEVQDKDEYDCYQWAKQNSGVDPMAPAQPAQQETKQKRGGAVKGAAKGAAVGTAVGAISGDPGKGAAIGAVTGSAAGAAGQAKANKAAAAQQQQQAQQAAANTKNEFNKAFGACLEGKGYTVK